MYLCSIYKKMFSKHIFFLLFLDMCNVKCAAQILYIIEMYIKYIFNGIQHKKIVYMYINLKLKRNIALAFFSCLFHKYTINEALGATVGQATFCQFKVLFYKMFAGEFSTH